MNVLDLFCGLKGWSRPFEEAGHNVVSIDIDSRFDATITKDIIDVSPREILFAFGRGGPDIILASPPCETFSVASIGTHWDGGSRAYIPKTPEAEMGITLAETTMEIIRYFKPKVAVVENPRGVLRKLGIFPVEPTTVWYCHYGESRAKPTDLWGMPFPPGWVPEPECHNRRKNHQPGCCCYDHEAAPRGARTGTQGIGDYAGRSEIPRGLAQSIADVCG